MSIYVDWSRDPDDDGDDLGPLAEALHAFHPPSDDDHADPGCPADEVE